MNLITSPDNSRRRIAAVGMYDGVHLGHRFLIDYLGVEARSRGLVPSVVTFMRHPLTVVRPSEAPMLLDNVEDRVIKLSEAGAEDIIMLSFNDSLHHMSAEKFLSRLKNRYGIQALVIGFNNRLGHDLPSTIDQYRTIGSAVGIDVIPAPEYRGTGAPISSSAIRQYLREGDIAKATEALGGHYMLRGKVVDGKHLGRTLGFPTANILPSGEDQLIPRHGVYAAWVTTPDGRRRRGVVNIGTRPTVETTPGAAPSIEVHIIDFQGYIYDEELRVEFVDRLRPERCFPSTDKLVAQIKEDIARANKILK
ncbi:MAG: riboflavin biosynthesis protein RibF [Bacteroides sp.]|nr:riboflavin biosynthesis protein RibF [Bacteroides sp.]